MMKAKNNLSLMDKIDKTRMGLNTVVIGIGNTLMGDDGAGPAVVSLLEKRCKNAELVALDTPGYSLLTYLTRKKKAIIVDAAFFGGQPGEVKALKLDQIKSSAEKSGLNLHDTDIVKVLEYAATLRLLPDEVTIMCIQVVNISPGTTLSPAVKQGVKQAAGLIAAACRLQRTRSKA